MYYSTYNTTRATKSPSALLAKCESTDHLLHEYCVQRVVLNEEKRSALIQNTLYIIYNMYKYMFVLNVSNSRTSYTVLLIGGFRSHSRWVRCVHEPNRFFLGRRVLFHTIVCCPARLVSGRYSVVRRATRKKTRVP